MKKLIKTVNLRFFEDDATGDFGLTHSDTIGNDSSFNAFWDGQGIFHDVFEHSHEHADKYFRGEFAMNVGGEMAAMGALWYYFDTLGFHSRLRDNALYRSGEIMRNTTQNMIEEAIKYGNFNFGHTLESNVPAQTETENESLEEELQTFCNEIKEYHPRLIAGTYDATMCAREIEMSHAYKASATAEKIKDLHRYGYRMAEKLVPNNFQNMNCLYNFLAFWNEFCKHHNAEELQNTYRGITFRLYRDENELISWKAVFVPHIGLSREEVSYSEIPAQIKSWDLEAA